ncbi:MAG: sel1 repeat family protein, partial [Lachnospiraceae bacterium]|nr:sel1 repeat family protein [Lachnospiraceae bacterium]
ETADERINAFLNDVLIPEDLQEQVRSDFDAVMYLCFRKTDRKSVAEIKRLIHEHECARDLAIIHEELLTSDDTDEQEARAMTEACDMFGLVVSTNLIANGYQQIRDIFKYARNLEKPVVSLEINKVNHADFYQIFTGAPACHDIRDARDIADRMQKMMDRLPAKEDRALTGQNQSQGLQYGQAAYHEFLMGTAYLAGIDMEIDYEKALKLLQYSAEQGNTEACRRLVLMYRRGQGVPIDEDKSFEWRSRYIDTLKTRFEESPDEETAAAYCLQLMSFGALYEKHGDYQRAATIYDEARSCYDKAGNLSRDLAYDGESISYTQLLTRLADVCRRIASYYGRIGYDNAALATYYLRKDIKLRKELRDMDGSIDNTWQLIISHMNLGIFDEDTYDVKSLQEAQALLKELTRDHPENQMYQDKLKLARDCEQKAAAQKNRRSNKNRKNSGGMLDNKKVNKDTGSSSRRKKGLLGRIFGRRS